MFLKERIILKWLVIRKLAPIQIYYQKINKHNRFGPNINTIIAKVSLTLEQFWCTIKAFWHKDTVWMFRQNGGQTPMCISCVCFVFRNRCITVQRQKLACEEYTGTKHPSATVQWGPWSTSNFNILKYILFSLDLNNIIRTTYIISSAR